MINKESLFAGYVFISLVVIAVLTGFLIKCRKDQTDCFCVCQGPAGEVCQNPKQLSHLYRKGTLTEYTDLAALQRMKGGAKWAR